MAGVWFGAWLCGCLGLWLLYVSRFGVGLAFGPGRAYACVIAERGGAVRARRGSSERWLFGLVYRRF